MTQKVTEVTTVTLDQAKARIEQETQAKLGRCAQEVDAVLKQYGCRIKFSIEICDDGKLFPKTQIVIAQ